MPWPLEIFSAEKTSVSDLVPLAAFGPVFGAHSEDHPDAALRFPIDGTTRVPGRFDAPSEPLRRILRNNASMLGLPLRQTPPAAAEFYRLI